MYWISKYALSDGILKAVLERCSNDEAGGYIISDGKRKNGFVSCSKEYWHSDRKDAVTEADLMRKKEILRLQKRIDKLNKMEF